MSYIQKHKYRPSVTVEIANAFIVDGQGGNPAGVVLNADGLSEADMQQVAKGVGLSETAFVSHSDIAGFKLDFFTPNRRIAHCGHATIAAFSLMASREMVSDGETSKETVDGPRDIVIRDGAAFMGQTAPLYSDPDDWRESSVSLFDVLDSLNLKEADLNANIQPVVVDTGNRFLLLAVPDQHTLAHLAPDLKRIEEISERLDLIGYYVFTTDTDRFDATTRMFGPRYAIPEEAATGMAAGPLGCLLFDRVGMKKEKMTIAQGDFMTPPSPSQLSVELRLQDSHIESLLVGGTSKVMESRVVILDKQAN